MKRVMVLITIALFLTSFAYAYEITITPRAIEDIENAGQGIQNQIQEQAKYQIEATFENVAKIQNRLQIHAQNGTCPDDCTCAGSTIKCDLEGSGREMTINAGNSGNTIIQVKGINASTDVELFRVNGKVYRTNAENGIVEVRVLPDQVQARVRERLARETEEEEIELDENGIYQYQARQRARLFGFIPVRERIRAEINSENGEIERLRYSWWGFLAKDSGEPIVGASCSTVTPDSRDECCQNKGYNSYNTETGECEFSSE